MATYSRSWLSPSHVIEYLKEGVRQIGLVSVMLIKAVRLIASAKTYWGETFYHIERMGIGSLPIVALSATFIGMAISVQFAQEIVARYGAAHLVGGFVAMAMFRELAPVFVAIVLAGNAGASMTAELGTMNVTEQVDALKVIRIDPIRYLVVPRLLAVLIIGPILSIMGLLLSLFSGQIFTEWLVDVPGAMFWESVQNTTTNTDMLNLVIKSVVFSIAIAIIASYNGLSTKGGAESVGKQTTKTVISCLLAIFILNYMVTSMFFSY